MSQAQKYHRRERTLYALLWKSGRVYIGQTIEPKRREQEHRRLWPDPFDFVRLGTMQGTQLEAEDHEYAWRWLAHHAGFEVVAKSRGGDPFVISNPKSRMTPERYAIAGRLRWPRAWRRRSPWSWILEWFAWQSGALAGCWLVLQLPLPAGW